MASSTTPGTAAPSEALQYFRFDESGLSFVNARGEHQLASVGVGAASHDGMGGVLYTTFDEAGAPGVYWTRPGVVEPETLDYLRGWAAILDGRPMLVGEKGIWSDDCPETTEEVHLVDLQTGDERLLGCFGGQDGGVSVTSGGGGFLVGTSWLAVGANGTDKQIHFYDTTGREIEHSANPVAGSCSPCELDAHLSADGSRLAYRLRPDAKWAEDTEERHRIDMLSYDEWWESTKDIPARVAVIDLASGEEVFSIAVSAGERLADFDGRRLVIESCELRQVEMYDLERFCVSRIISIEGGQPEIEVEGGVRLANEVCCSSPVGDVFPPLLRVWSPYEGQVVDSRTYVFEGIADPEAEIVAAGRYPVTVEPHGTWNIVLVLRPGGNLATITATDAAGNTTIVRRAVTYQPPLTLRHDGLSLARFGDPAQTAVAAVTNVLGPPDSDVVEQASDCYLSVEQTRFVTWESAGLRLVFTDWGGTHQETAAAPLHLSDWEVVGPGLVMEDGLGWGSTTGELRATHHEVLIGIDEFVPAFLVPVPSGWIMGGFDWSSDDFLDSLQRALNEQGADLEITGSWDGATTQALFNFMESQGMEDASAALGVLGLPPDDVQLAWMHAGKGPLCD